MISIGFYIIFSACVFITLVMYFKNPAIFRLDSYGVCCLPTALITNHNVANSSVLTLLVLTAVCKLLAVN